MKHTIITIGRGFGAGGNKLSRRLSDKQPDLPILLRREGIYAWIPLSKEDVVETYKMSL